VSCIAISNPALDKTTPVKPPIVNKTKKPPTQYIGVFNLILPPHKVAIQLKIFMPVGTAIIIVAAVKYARVSTSIPTVYI
jgi:hypothetical protein